MKNVKPHKAIKLVLAQSDDQGDILGELSGKPIDEFAMLVPSTFKEGMMSESYNIPNVLYDDMSKVFMAMVSIDDAELLKASGAIEDYEDMGDVAQIWSMKDLLLFEKTLNISVAMKDIIALKSYKI